MRIVLPWPDPKLNPNQYKGKHWSSAAAARKKARSDAFWITRGALLENLAATGKPFDSGAGTLDTRITFFLPTRQPRDLDNLLAALKPSLDGIADSLGVNDNLFEPITIVREHGGKPGKVVVEVRNAV